MVLVGCPVRKEVKEKNDGVSEPAESFIFNFVGCINLNGWRTCIVYNSWSDKTCSVDNSLEINGVCLFGTELCSEPKFVLDSFETPP